MSLRQEKLLFLRFEAWGADMRGYSQQTRRGYSYRARVANSWLRDTYGIGVAFAKLPQLKAFLFSTKPTARNRNAHRQALMAFYDFLIDEGIRDDNPAAALPRLKVPRPIPKALSAEQVRDVLRAAKALGVRYETLASLLAYQGMRNAETRRLRWQQLEEEPGFVRFVAKGEKPRRLPLHPEVVRVLGAWKARCKDAQWVFPSPRGNGQPMSVATVQRMMKEIGAMAGVPQLHAHLFRHSFATRLLQQGSNVKTVSVALGHNSLQSTSIYLTVHDPVLEKDMEALAY